MSEHEIGVVIHNRRIGLGTKSVEDDMCLYGMESLMALVGKSLTSIYGAGFWGCKIAVVNTGCIGCCATFKTPRGDAMHSLP